MSDALLIGVIIVLILSITFEWGWISQNEIDNVKWKLQPELDLAVELLGKPEYLDPNKGGSALWKNPGGINKSELIITDCDLGIQMNMGLDIFDETRRNEVMIDQREFYRMLLEIHKLDNGIFYDASQSLLWIKSDTLTNCFHTALSAKNMDLRPVPKEFDFDFIDSYMNR